MVLQLFPALEWPAIKNTIDITISNSNTNFVFLISSSFSFFYSIVKQHWPSFLTLCQEARLLALCFCRIPAYLSGHEAMHDLFSDKHLSVQLESASQLVRQAITHVWLILLSPAVHFESQLLLQLFMALLHPLWQEFISMPHERTHCGFFFANAMP